MRSAIKKKKVGREYSRNGMLEMMHELIKRERERERERERAQDIITHTHTHATA